MMELCDCDGTCEKGDVLAYPESIREKFCETRGYTLDNGRYISAAEIWRFMTQEAPARFPYRFVDNGSCEAMSRDVNFFSGIKRYYLSFTIYDRLMEKQRAGRPMAIVQYGHPYEVYRAAGYEPVGPEYASTWLWRQIEGQGLKESEQRMVDLMEEYRKSLPAECCNLIASYPASCNETVPVDIIAPMLIMRCSDVAYAVESCRSDRKLPINIVDYPVNNHSGEWRVEYLAKELRRLANKLGELSGKEVTDDVLIAEIKKENLLRKLGGECQKKWWSAKVPPTNSEDNYFAHISTVGLTDLNATTQLMKETRNELTSRIKKGVKGFGLCDDPSRVLVCGSCACLYSSSIREGGGVDIGHDERISQVSMQVRERGDPYYNLAEALCSLPYEKYPEERGEWTAEIVKESRADGVVFIYNWGCNYQSSVSRLITDIVKERTGVPTICIEKGELGRMQSSEQLQNRIDAFMEMIR